MMQNSTYSRPLGQYRQASVETADRGQLVIMIYDHCVKWCGIAHDALKAGQFAKKAEATHKVLSGLNELMVSLDMEKGGDISKNLWRLYEFYSFHLTEGNTKNIAKNYTEVQEMLSSLREAWVFALNEVRKDKNSVGNNLSSTKNFVSMVG